MVNKTFLSLAIAAVSAGLAGCNISSVDGNDKVDARPIEAGQSESAPTTVTPLFNPARSVLPTANDFLLGGSSDGTLKFGDGGVEEPLTASGRNPNYNPVYDALNDLDGFSTVAPIDIAFNGSLSSNIEPGNIFLVPLNYGIEGPKLGSLDDSAPFLINSISDLPSIDVSAVTYADVNANENGVLRITPLKPLKENTRYLVVILKGLKDSRGVQIGMPSQFEYLIGDLDLLNPALAPARSATKGWLELANGFSAQLPDAAGVSLAYSFTTGGTSAVMNMMAAPGNANKDLSNASIPASVQYYLNTTQDTQDIQLTKLTAMVGNSATAQALIAGYSLLSTMPAPTPRKVDFSNSALISTGLLVSGAKSGFRGGRIKLPYYLKAPNGSYDGENPSSGYACLNDSVECAANKLSASNVVTSYWEADEDLIFNALIAAGASEIEATKKKAPSEKVTNLFPFARQQGLRSVPVLAVEPVDSCVKPESGWPVVIIQHGLRSNRMESLALADQFSQACYASLAIDLVMHGPMPTDTFTYQIPHNGEVSIPLMALVEASENSSTSLQSFLTKSGAEQVGIITQQALAQRHFGLTANGATPVPVSSDDASLNSSGSLFINFIRFQATRDNIRQSVMDLMNLNASIHFIDINGDGKSDLDKDKIFFAGISLGGIVGSQFVAINNANTLVANSDKGNSALNPVKAAAIGVAGGGLTRLLEGSPMLGATIVNALTDPDAFNLTKGGADYDGLMYVYQATVDAADPINYAAQLHATGTPYTFIKSTGDLVVPNSVTDAPLSGTDPLITELGATVVNGSTDFSEISPVQVAVTLTDEFSNHSSMFAPDTDEQTPETAETFAVLARHMISLFNDPTNPVLDDSGNDIIETINQ